ncbi:MAG TPA: archaeosortase/exosortase family protein, partial [Planctomycetaceae bacterium]|nr:archaeosortase/exosortase family protein [Planctomycetaceae bacterium]
MATSQSLESTPGQAEVPSPPPKRIPRIWLTIGIVLSGVLVWSYWSTLGELVRTWNSSPDYSHGFLVAPLAAWFLWRRRATFPSSQLAPS